MYCCYQTPKTIVIGQSDNCGVTVDVTSSTNCTSICGDITYTVTITNHSTVPMSNVCLHVPLDCVLCLHTDSVTLNGESVTVTALDNIPVGDIAAGESAVVVYTVTVMEFKRCIVTRSAIKFCTCCCFKPVQYIVASCPIVVQCCNCCCCCCNNTSTTNS